MPITVRVVGDGALRYRSALSGSAALDFGWVDDLAAPPPMPWPAWPATAWPPGRYPTAPPTWCPTTAVRLMPVSTGSSGNPAPGPPAAPGPRS